MAICNLVFLRNLLSKPKAFGTAIEVATRSADASGQSPINKLRLINLESALETNTSVCSLNHPPTEYKSKAPFFVSATRPSWHFPVFHVPDMLRMLEMQGMSTTTYRNRPNLCAQDFKTFRHATLTKHRKYQRCGECWECSRLAKKKCKKKKRVFRYFRKATVKN